MQAERARRHARDAGEQRRAADVDRDEIGLVVVDGDGRDDTAQVIAHADRPGFLEGDDDVAGEHLQPQGLVRAGGVAAARAYLQLALADTQVRGRAFEGVGFGNEMLAESDAASKDKHLDDALASFKQLEAIDTKGFKELGKYHEARVIQAKGDKDKAIALLKEVHTAVSSPDEEHQFEYLETVVEDRLRELDPTALPPKAAKRPGGAAGGPGGGEMPDMNDPRIQELLRQLQQQQKPGMGAPAPGAPAP